MTVAIPSDEKAVLQAIADKADLSLSDAVIKAVRDFIETHHNMRKILKKS